MGPVLPEVLGGIDAVEAAIGIGHQCVQPALVSQVLSGIAGKEWCDDRNTSLCAIGSVGRWIDEHRVRGRRIAVILDRRIANGSGHQVPNLAAIGAAEDAFAAEGGINSLNVAGWV